MTSQLADARAITIDFDAKATPPAHFMTLHCDRCRASERRRMKRADLPPDAIAKFMRNVGWEVDAKCRHATCPKCQKKGATVTEISSEALKRQRQMFHLLDEFFDADAGRFAKGWSDEKIAEQTGLAAAAVRKAREAAYGALKVNPEVAKLTDELAAMRERYGSQITELENMVAELRREMERAGGAIEARLQALVKAA